MTPVEVWRYNYITWVLGRWKHGLLAKTYLRINKIAHSVKDEVLDEMVDYLNDEKTRYEYALQCIKCSSPCIGMYVDRIKCYKRLIRINKIIAYINKVKSRFAT